MLYFNCYFVILIQVLLFRFFMYSLFQPYHLLPFLLFMLLYSCDITDTLVRLFLGLYFCYHEVQVRVLCVCVPRIHVHAYTLLYPTPTFLRLPHKNTVLSRMPWTDDVTCARLYMRSKGRYVNNSSAAVAWYTTLSSCNSFYLSCVNSQWFIYQTTKVKENVSYAHFANNCHGFYGAIPLCTINCRHIAIDLMITPLTKLIKKVRALLTLNL